MGRLFNALAQFVGPDEFLELLAIIVSESFEVDIGISYDPYRTVEHRQRFEQGRQLGKKPFANTLSRACRWLP